jgi:hypothetical protein
MRGRGFYAGLQEKSAAEGCPPRRVFALAARVGSLKLVSKTFFVSGHDFSRAEKYPENTGL